MKRYLNRKNAVKLTVAGIVLTVASMFYMAGCTTSSSSGGIEADTCNIPQEAYLNTQKRIGGAVTNVKSFIADDNISEWTLYNIANELRATRVDTPDNTVGLEVEGFIRDIEIVTYNDKRYAILAMGEEGITAVDITNPESIVIKPNVKSVKVNYYHEGINWTEGGGDVVYDNNIYGTRGSVSSLAVYDEGNATVPSLQLLIGDEKYGIHKTTLSNLFGDTNESRETDGTLKIDQEVYTLQYAGENPWGGPKSLTLFGEGNSARIFVAQGFLGMGIFDPKTLDKVGRYNHYTNTGVLEDWFINMDVSTQVQSDANGSFIDSCTKMPDYKQTSYEITEVWHNKVVAPTPWADFDRYGKFYYDARKIDVATFGGTSIAYIAYGLGGMVAVDVTGYDTAQARDASCTFDPNFLEGAYLGYVPGLPAHGPDAQTSEQSKSLFPYFGAGMLKESGIVDVKVNADTKEVYFTDHFAGLMVIGNADNPAANWKAGVFDNDDNNILGDHWPDYEFVTSYDMTPMIPEGKEESVPTFINESPILLATGEVSGHGNVFSLTSTFDPAGNGMSDVLLTSGGGGLNFIDVYGTTPRYDFDVSVHFATTEEIGAASDGSATQEINIGHAEGVAAYGSLLFLGDGPHGMSVWQVADDQCQPTDDVHLVANTLQSEYPVEVNGTTINPTPHAHEVILDHATNSALVMSQSRGVRRVNAPKTGVVGAPILLYPGNTDIYEHNKDEGNIAEFLSMQDHAYSAALKGSLAFTADGSNGLTVYDLSKDPTNASNSNSFVVANIGGDTNSQPDLGRVSGVALWDDTRTGISYAFVAAGSRGIAVVDVSDVRNNNMSLIKIFEPIKMEDDHVGKADGKSVAVKVVGNHAFFTYDSFGVVSYSIADLIAPLIEGTDPQDIWTKGGDDQRPVAAARFKLQDASMFGSDEFAGWSGGSVGMDAVSLFGRNLFYVAYGDAGVIKIDWTNPSQPVLMEHINTVGSASDVAVINGRVYVADGGGGLALLK